MRHSEQGQIGEEHDRVAKHGEGAGEEQRHQDEEAVAGDALVLSGGVVGEEGFDHFASVERRKWDEVEDSECVIEGDGNAGHSGEGFEEIKIGFDPELDAAKERG